MQLSPEQKLVLHCARSRMEEQVAAEVQRILEAPLDWGAILSFATYHRLTSLFYWNLNTISKSTPSGRVPENVLSELRKSFRQNAQRNLFLSGQLFKLLACFEKDGIEVIPYKGPVQAAAIYADLALRQFRDLDFLLRPQDVGRANDFLQRQGYVCFSPEPTEVLISNSGYEYHCSYQHREGHTLIELHWQVLPEQFSLPMDYESIFEKARTADFLGRPVKTLAWEDTVLLLIIHGARHGWQRLYWLCDLAELLRTPVSTLDWTNLMQRTDSLGCQRMLYSGLLLAGDVLQAPLPVEIATEANRDAASRKLALGLADRIATGRKFTSLETHRYYLASRDRCPEKLRYIMLLLLSPRSGVGDVEGTRQSHLVSRLKRMAHVLKTVPRHLIRSLTGNGRTG